MHSTKWCIIPGFIYAVVHQQWFSLSYLSPIIRLRGKKRGSCPHFSFVLFVYILCTYQRQAGRGRQGIGRGFDRSLWPGGREFELSCCPGSRDVVIIVRACDHKSFPGVGNFSIFDLTFLPRGREFDSNFWENVKIPPYAPPPPAGLTLIVA